MSENKRTHTPLISVFKREELPRSKSIMIRVATFIGSFFVAMFLCFLVIKENYFGIIGTMFAGAVVRPWKLFMDTALLLAFGIAIVPAFKMKFWNLGGNGQILMGALVTVAIMRSSIGENSPAIANILMLIGSIVIGAIWAVIPAIFKAFFTSYFKLWLN